MTGFLNPNRWPLQWVWGVVLLTWLSQGLGAWVASHPNTPEAAGLWLFSSCWGFISFSALTAWIHQIAVGKQHVSFAMALRTGLEIILPLNLLLAAGIVCRASGIPRAFTLVEMAVLAWVAARAVQGIQDLYRLPRWGALLTALSPLLLIALLGILFLGISGLMILGSLSMVVP